MWIRETRGRMAELGQKTKRYPSGLTDEEWAPRGRLLGKLEVVLLPISSYKGK
jgi:hypothetical protein